MVSSNITPINVNFVTVHETGRDPIVWEVLLPSAGTELGENTWSVIQKQQI